MLTVRPAQGPRRTLRTDAAPDGGTDGPMTDTHNPIDPVSPDWRYRTAHALLRSARERMIIAEAHAEELVREARRELEAAVCAARSMGFPVTATALAAGMSSEEVRLHAAVSGCPQPGPPGTRGEPGGAGG